MSKTIEDKDYYIYDQCQYDTCLVCDYNRRAICREIRLSKLENLVKRIEKNGG